MEELMKCSALSCLILFIAGVATADDARDAAIKKDYQQLAGKWQVVAVEIDGQKLSEADARKFSVVNGADGSWSLLEAGKEIDKGTSNIDPTKTPKTIDLTPTTGESKDKLHRAIYELGEKTRKLCIAGPDKPRPADFTAKAGSEQILVTFERITQK
jgi:uncharacterized protein (TIGR03067 family)